MPTSPTSITLILHMWLLSYTRWLSSDCNQLKASPVTTFYVYLYHIYQVQTSVDGCFSGSDWHVGSVSDEGRSFHDRLHFAIHLNSQLQQPQRLLTLFHNLCWTASSLTRHKTDSVSARGHAWSVAMSSQGRTNYVSTITQTKAMPFKAR